MVLFSFFAWYFPKFTCVLYRRLHGLYFCNSKCLARKKTFVVLNRITVVTVYAKGSLSRISSITLAVWNDASP